jgi:hypothetical protein
MLEYWAEYQNARLTTLFQYSIFPLFLLYVTLKPVKNIATGQMNNN